MQTAPFILAAIVMAGVYSPAMAQVAVPQAGMPTGIDCSNPANAIEYYCNHRDQFNSSGAFTGAGQPASAGSTGSVRRHHVVHHAVHKVPHHSAHS